MSYVSLRKILSDAKAKRYAIDAFNLTSDASRLA